MKHLGDITKISGYEVPIVDVVVGGSPCQDLSVAGKREGLAGERSGLFMEQIRIIKEMRDGVSKELRSRGSDEYIRPRYMVWENVPGAFSSNKGEDFRVVLEETARVADKTAVIPKPEGGWKPSGAIMGDGWSIAWRVHDAQFWGVPQRRKRIALVADFGGATAPEILFEREGVPGDFEESREARQGTATDAERGIDKAISFQERGGKPGGDKGILIQNERTGALSTLNNQSVCCLNDQGGSVMGVSENVTGALRAQEHGHQPRVYGISAYNGTEHHAVCVENHPADSRVQIKDDGIVQTLSGRMGTGGGNVPMVIEPVCVGNGQLAQARISDKVRALNCMHDQQAVITYGLDRASFNQGKNAKFNFSVDEELVGAQTAKGPGAVYNSVVRRLTPLECTRLQAYPDGWVDIGEWVDSKGKTHKDADSPKYKALGNSIALPFWEWMAKRMRPYLGNNPTMASLFDGIGGFPLVFTRAGFTPVWASEIEEFPMAVTKLRFPSEEE